MVYARPFRRAVWGLAVATMFFALGCDSPAGPGHPYMGIAELFPADGAVDQDLNINLRWAIETDTVMAAPSHYRVFLGTQTPLPLVMDSLTENSFMPGTLAPKTVYAWRVEAYRDTVIIASTPTMRFTTGREFTYPLAVGLRWIYWHETYSYTADGQPNPVYRDTGRATVGIVGFTTIWDYIDAYDFYIMEQVGAEYHTCHFYLNNIEDGLYTLDYTGTSLIAPRLVVEHSGKRFLFAGRVFDSPDQLFSALRGEMVYAAKRPGPTPEGYSPTISYAYPLRLGHQWTYRDHTDEGYPFRIDKKVIRREQVSTQAGVFDCLVIQWFWDIDDDGMWESGIDGYDYLAPQGLIKREFYVAKVGTQPYDNPEEIVYYDFFDGYTLTAHGRGWEHPDGVTPGTTIPAPPGRR